VVIHTANQSEQSKWELLAQALLTGDCGLEQNPTKAVQILKELASNVPINKETNKPILPVKNDNQIITPKAFTPTIKQIAECYLDGMGIPQRNSHIGLAWLEAAYHYGDDADSAHETALIYEYGRHNIDVDVVAAAQWFERVANQGHVEAMAELGLCYELGCGVEQSDENTLDWYTKAANFLGNALAKFSVGEMFEEARGVPQSDELACLW
jgi:TPR repeat protein